MSKLYIRPKPGIILATIALMVVSKPLMSQQGLNELGRLFTDPVQREKLDAVRRGTYKGDAELKSTVSTITVNGIMVRSDGENIVWVNGKSTLEGSAAQGIDVDIRSTNRESYNVPVTVNGKRVSIKPGQSWAGGTGAVKDNY